MKITKQIFFLCFALNSMGTVSADIHVMNDEEAHLMAIASDCAYQLNGLNDKDNIQECLDKHNAKVTYVDSFVAASRLGIDAYYWAKTTDDGRMILSFRGTLPPPTKDNKVDDYFQLMQIKYDWLNDAAIKLDNNRHKGFSDSWNRLKLNLDKGACSANKGRITEGLGKSKALLITGHSKGAALATLAAFDIATPDSNSPIHVDKDNIYVYTFEGPRVFNKQGAENYNKTVTHHWRHEFNNDIVPHLPLGEGLPEDQKKMVSHLGAILGLDLKNLENKQLYQHIGQLKYLDDAGNKTSYAQDNDNLKKVRLDHQLKAMQPKLSTAEIAKKLFSIGIKVKGLESLPAAMIEIKEIYQSNANTLIDDHSLCHWEKYFEKHVVTDCKINP